MDNELQGRSVVITGGAGAIGQAMARRFLSMGAQVVVGDTDRAALGRLHAEFGDLLGQRVCDVTDESDCARLIDFARARAGRDLDVFIANAGLPFAGALREARAADIARVIAVNVTGSILSARAAIDSLARGVDPVMLFMGSLQSVTGRAERSVYTASKHAIAGLVKALALELGPLGIRVNAIAPTVLDTPFLHAAYQQAGHAVEDGLRAAAQALPLGRIPTVEDVANLAVFLASTSARSITGQIMLLDGGASAGKFAPAAARG